MRITKTTIVFITLIIGLFFIGLRFYGDFIQWFLIKRDNVVYQTYSISGQFHNSLIFAGNLAVAPLFALVLGKTWRQKITALGFIVLCIAAAILVKRFMLLMSINKLPSTGESIVYPISLDNLKLNPAMTMGIIVGYWTMYLCIKYQHKFHRHVANTGLPNSG